MLFPYLNLLPQVIFWPDNILDLFKKFNVKKNFDFLSGIKTYSWITNINNIESLIIISVDTDSYDFFMTEAILKVASFRKFKVVIQKKVGKVKLKNFSKKDMTGTFFHENQFNTQGGYQPRVIMMEYNANFEVCKH